jgi:tricorn protease
MVRRVFLILLALVCVSFLGNELYAQLPIPDPKPIIGGRVPALSPDGAKLAFVYKGDIWIADSAGGRATAITRNVEMDSFPQFSPDGNWISFSSTRNGNWDIYLVPATGGPVTQLTYHSAGDIAYDWNPDGKSLIFSSKRDTEDIGLYTIDIKTLRLRKLTQDYLGMNYSNFSPDGKLVVYGRNGFFSWTRPRYVGSGASQMWILDTKTGARHALAPNDKQHLWTRFMPDGRHVITVTVGDATPCTSKLGTSIGKFTDTPARTPNLWMFDLNGKGKQITSFVGGSVRFPNVAAETGDIVFEYEQDLWILKSGQKQPKKITLYASEDETQNRIRHETLKSDVKEAEPSPDGKYFAFGIRGDIWTVLVSKPKGVEGKSTDIAKRLTDWAGDDSDFVWSSDGKKLYFTSDREFNTRLYELDVESLAVRPLWNRLDNVSHPEVSPDGKELGFWVTGPEGGLYTQSIATGERKRLANIPAIQTYGHGGGEFEWSPDMKWMAYTFGEENGAWNIWIVPTTGGDAVNVTRLNSYHGSPIWSPDGKYMFFQSNRDGDGIYVLPLVKEAALSSEMDIKFEKPKDPIKVDIDFTDITRRIRKLSSQNPDGNLAIAADGKIIFTSGGDIWSVTYDGKDTKKMTSEAGCTGLRLDKEGKKGYYIRNGELWTIVLDDSAKQEKTEFVADWDRDVRAERKAAFTQLWRNYNRLFYDSNMHGRDWEAIRKRYEPFLDAVETREEFATMLAMMVGELECSHAEVGPAWGGNPSSTTPHLGFTFDYSYEGPGIHVDKVPTGTPGSFTQTQIKPGEYVLAINSQDVTLDENLFKFINDKQDREFTFLVNSKPVKEGARTVKYTNMSYGNWDNLMYKNRIERLRKLVEDKSGGEIGYVHVSGMGAENQTQFEREFYEYAIGKKGMIIDVRFNGGGYISDGLIDWLERKPHGFSQTRDEAPRFSPGQVWDKPIVVLMNECSYSNGEMFPSAMRVRGLAKLVGVPTPGYVIAVYELPLVDGTRARMPFVGIYREDGTTLENDGEKPDYFVSMSPDDWVAERDPQLDKALEVLSAEVK